MRARPAGGRASDIVVVFPRKRPRLERVPIAVQHPLNKPSSGSLVVVVVFVVFVVVGAVAGDDVRVGGDAGGGGGGDGLGESVSQLRRKYTRFTRMAVTGLKRIQATMRKMMEPAGPMRRNWSPHQPPPPPPPKKLPMNPPNPPPESFSARTSFWPPSAPMGARFAASSFLPLTTTQSPRLVSRFMCEPPPGTAPADAAVARTARRGRVDLAAVGRIVTTPPMASILFRFSFPVRARRRTDVRGFAACTPSRD